MATASVQHEQEVSPSAMVGSDGGQDGAVVCLHEYLTTPYSPDCEYVDGHLEVRNLGELDHARMQSKILFLFTLHAEEWQIEALAELRLQVSSTNYRIPDIMLLPAGHNEHRIVKQAPLLLIEVLSPEDTLKRLYEKIKEYLALGVKHIWVFDPSARIAYRCDKAGFHTVFEEEMTVPNTAIYLKLSEVFGALNK